MLRFWLMHQAIMWSGFILFQGFISARNIWRYRPWEVYTVPHNPWLEARLHQLRLFGLGYDA